MIFGQAPLGAAQFTKLMIDNWPVGQACDVFTQTFGDAYPFVSMLAKSGKCPRIELSLLFKGKVPGRPTYPTNLFPGIVKECKRFVPLMRAYPNIIWDVCGMTEHNSGASQAQQLCNMILNVVPPTVNYANNPQQGSGALIPSGPRVLNEVHGAHATPVGGRMIFNFDGNSAYNFNVTQLKATFAAAEVFYIWCCRYNGKYEDDEATPIANRTGWATKADILGCVALCSPEGPTNLPSNWLYKSHAENNGNGDPRAEKGLFIIPKRTNKMDIRTRSGKIVGTFNYYGPFVDGRSRYYSQEYGYVMADRAKNIQGDPLCDVWVGGKKYGVINPSFRIGSFQ